MRSRQSTPQSRRRLSLTLVAVVPLASCHRCGLIVGDGLVVPSPSAAQLRPPRRRVALAAQLSMTADADDDELSGTGADAKWSDSEPESMIAIGRALELESVAPQWRVAAGGDDAGLPQRVQPLREEELAAIEAAEESAHGLSELERELLRRSVASLDYLGDWADTKTPPSDSIVLCCVAPEVHMGENGPEYTCRYNDFTAERHQLHAHIVERMLTSTRTTAGNQPASSSAPPAPILTLTDPATRDGSHT